ncbi:MAG: bifunctional metallophosphatase/5'-nucleotidase [Bdellovibrionales bacterium]|nr:bifunctional metallophosphatase/5'-nucleotidase [Bdellovibrionales bacterium]
MGNLGKLTSFALRALASFVILAPTPQAYGKPVDLIFINDLHSYMEPHLDGETGVQKGGYAKVKTIIDQMRSDAKAQGREVLALNGGDFLEGHPFYFVENGLKSFQAIDQFQFDASVMGNHDWLMNATGLNALAESFMAVMKTPFEFLGANFSVQSKSDQDYGALAQSLKPYKTVEKDGIRYAILGLTTPSFLYKWAAADGKSRTEISNPYKTAKAWVPELRKNHDFVIALTHLGDDVDHKLIEKVEGIDFVVGGHTHSLFTDTRFAKNPKGLMVPYFQTESFGGSVGRVTLDIEKGKPVTVVPGTFEQRPVDATTADEPKMAQLVSDTRKGLENQFGAAWLHEVIAVSKVALVSGEKGNPTNLSQLFINSIKNSTDVDFAFDLGVFHGISVPAGAITRESILQLHPRMFEFNKTGWNIYRAKMKGAYIKAMIQAAARFNFFFTSKGLDYELVPSKKDPKRFLAKGLNVAGKKIRTFKTYTVATSEGMIRGAIAALPIMKLILRRAVDTKITMWDAIEKELRKVAVVDDKSLPWPSQAFPGGKKMPPITPLFTQVENPHVHADEEAFEEGFAKALFEELVDAESGNPLDQ